MRIGKWTGEDIAVDERITQATGAEVTVDRLYRNAAEQAVMAHCAMFQKFGVRILHSPEECYAGNGFQIVHSTLVRLPLESQTEITARLLTLERKGETVYVLYWYQFNDRSFVDGDGQRRVFLTFRGKKFRPPLIKVMLQAKAPSGDAAKGLLSDMALPLFQWTSQYR